MMLLVCMNSGCSSAFRILGEPIEIETLVGSRSDFWPDKYKCPVCDRRAIFFMENNIPDELVARLAVTQIRVLEPQEMFRAQHGLGLPEEQNCTREAVEEALKQNPIRRIGGHAIGGSPTFCLEFLELWNGVKMYFGASSHGAVVYRIVQPTKASQRVLGEIDG